MNDKDKLIERLIQEKGGTKEEYLSLLDAIAYHESAHTLDPKVKQHGGGPGRGKYQFEEGKNQGGITAARRTKRYLEQAGEAVPEWLDKATQADSLDATRLTSEQQDVLFLGNMRMHPKADFAKVINGEETITDFWANYHWAGSDEDRDERVASFENSLESYKRKSPDQIEETKIKKQIADYTNEQRATAQQRDNIPPQPSLKVETPLAQQRKPLQFTQQEEQQAQQVPPTAQLNTQDYGDLMGYLKSNASKLTEYNSGGKHEQNPFGGVPIGTGANGKTNTVEEGETSYNFGEDKFVFSDRINVNDKKNNTVKLINTPIDNTFAFGGSLNGECGGPGQPPCPKKPLVVEDENHPRYKAYQDSLNLYQTQQRMNAEYLSNFKEVEHPKGHEPNMDLWKMIKESPATLKKGYQKREAVATDFLNDISRRGVVNIPPNDKTNFGSTRNVIGDKLHAGKYKTNAEANERNLLDKIGIFDDDTKSTIPYNEVTTTDGDRVYITPRRKAWDAEDGILGTKLGKKDNTRYYSGYSYGHITHPDIKPTAEIDYHYATDAHNSQGRTSTTKAHEIDPTDWNYDDGRLFNVNIKHYKKPEQPVVVSGEKPELPQRAKVKMPESSIRMTRDIDTEIVGEKVKPPVKKAPEVDYWEYKRSTTGFGATTTTGKTYDTDKVHRMLDQQERDRKSKTGKKNKLKVKPVFKRNNSK